MKNLPIRRKLAFPPLFAALSVAAAACRGGLPVFDDFSDGDAASASAPARVRPLLRVRHTALAAFLRAEGLAWREDATNAADDADRNRIRHRVVPAVLDAFGPSFLATLARTMDLLRDDADLLDALARAEGPCTQHPASGIQHSPSLLRRRIAAELYAAGVDPEAVTLDAIERIRRLLVAHRGGSVPLGRGVAARVKGGALRVEPLAPPSVPRKRNFLFPDV